MGSNCVANMDTISKKICRLCLKLIFDNNLVPVETVATRMLNALLLKLNLEVSLDPVMCNECKENLQKSLDFKKILLDVQNKLYDEIAQMPNASKDRNAACRFCMNYTKRDELAPFFETKENMFLVDLLKTHFLELDVNDPEEFLTCEHCIEYLKNLSGFIWNCLEVEEKIRKYIEIKGANNKGQIDLCDVQESIAKPVLKDEISNNVVNEIGIQHTYDEKDEITIEFELKNEDIMEVDISTLNIMAKQFDSSESKHVGNESLLVTSTSKKTKAKSKNIHKCNKCTYKTKTKSYLKNHMIIHKDQSEITWHKCTQCSFQTKHKVSLKTHSLLHKVPSEVKMFKCHTCSYETKHKGNLIKHVVVHKNASQLSLYKCDKCGFETKHRNSINDHKAIHKDHPVIYQCDKCIHMSYSKSNMKKHMQRHNLHTDSSALKSVKKFTCETCPYETKDKRALQAHMISHATEVIKLECKMCSFTTKYRRALVAHMRTHNYPETVYKCDMCFYESKRKSYIRKHINSKHKPFSEIKWYKCKLCKFETKYRTSFTNHEVTHKDPSEIVWHKCTWCLYKSSNKNYLKKHLLTHRIYNPIYKDVYL